MDPHGGLDLYMTHTHTAGDTMTDLHGRKGYSIYIYVILRYTSTIHVKLANLGGILKYRLGYVTSACTEILRDVS